MWVGVQGKETLFSIVVLPGRDLSIQLDRQSVKEYLFYGFEPGDPSERMRLDENFRYLFLTPPIVLLVNMLKGVSVWNVDQTL